ncbi:hypothetical protein EST38_g12447 [Candolleomyces aberdarensis]|uniref:Uncharacterized protein n=1 Tax=Candolleomyces aberdarensis TaxID=2316362 RepID=A0A4Q2D2F3_9AGAR|nr:hypothetical protein EST38_g12447 [Candolleomyces aberdarensis]
MPKLLEDEKAWDMLKDTVKDFRAAAMAKNKGKGTVPQFSVILVDTAGPGGSRGSSNKTKKASSSKCGVLSADSADENAGALSREEGTILKAIKAIERKHHCEKHGRACVLTDSGICYQLTNGDVAKWAKLMAVVDHPPDELNISDLSARQHSVVKKSAGAQKPADAEPPAWLAQAMGFSMFMQQAQAAQFMNALSPGPRSNMVPSMPKRSYDQVESDDSFDMGEWLSSLDSDPIRGLAKDDFAQLGWVKLGRVQLGSLDFGLGQ